MKEQLKKLQEKDDVNLLLKPIFYRLPVDHKKLSHLIDNEINITVFDQLNGQLSELIKLQNPSIKFNEHELEKAKEAHLKGIALEEYGVWVYYPWTKRLVHILDEKEFVEVRTSRNQFKITPKEKNILATKKIGVIGLSVGQSVSVTMAMERIFGEIRLADFDILELSNYNRIRSGLHNLNLPKVIAVAREIAEIDPFLKVTCFPEGITEKNIDDFLMKNGKLDLLLDECDGLSIKILCRQKAKALKIPVVMETSDRGMVDVERFDLEPSRSILHGLIDHLEVDKIKEAKTNEEKIKFILPMVGIDKISSRLKASMMEVEQSITTWPQLASAVTLGGGVAADVSRRIILNQFKSSGRFYVDVEKIIGDQEPDSNASLKRLKNYHLHSSISFEEMRRTARALPIQKEKNLFKPSKKVIKELVTAATTAPSGGNCQPWKWLYSNGMLYLFFDRSKSKSFLDYNDVSAHLSLGAACENLILKSHQIKLKVRCKILPYKKDQNLIAQFYFLNPLSKAKNTETHKFDDLAEAIYIRETNRNISERKLIPGKSLDDMKRIVNMTKGAKLHFADSEKELKILAEIAGACDRLRFLHPQCHYDMYFNEVRWNKKENQRTRDGVDIETIPFTASELSGFKMAKDPNALSYLREWNGGKAFEKISKKTVLSASAIGFMTMPKYNSLNYIEGGRSVERLWLWANKNGFEIHPIMVPLMLFTRLVNGKGAELSQNMIDELTELRSKFLTVFNPKKKSAELFLFKIFIANKPKVKSLRRSVDKVLYFH